MNLRPDRRASRAPTHHLRALSRHVVRIANLHGQLPPPAELEQLREDALDLLPRSALVDLRSALHAAYREIGRLVDAVDEHRLNRAPRHSGAEGASDGPV